jgi:hypothetical protein
METKRRQLNRKKISIQLLISLAQKQQQVKKIKKTR